MRSLATQALRACSAGAQGAPAHGLSHANEERTGITHNPRAARRPPAIPIESIAYESARQAEIAFGPAALRAASISEDGSGTFSVPSQAPSGTAVRTGVPGRGSPAAGGNSGGMRVGRP